MSKYSDKVERRRKAASVEVFATVVAEKIEQMDTFGNLLKVVSDARENLFSAMQAAKRIQAASKGLATGEANVVKMVINSAIGKVERAEAHLRRLVSLNSCDLTAQQEARVAEILKSNSPTPNACGATVTANGGEPGE